MNVKSIQKGEEIQSMPGIRKFRMMKQNLMLIYVASHELGIYDDSRFCKALRESIKEIDGYLSVIAGE